MEGIGSGKGILSDGCPSRMEWEEEGRDGGTSIERQEGHGSGHPSLKRRGLRGRYRFIHPTESGKCSSEHGGAVDPWSSWLDPSVVMLRCPRNYMTQLALPLTLETCHLTIIAPTTSARIVNSRTVAGMTRDLLPEELVESLLQQSVVLILQSHGYTAIHPLALNLLIETVEKRSPPLSFTWPPPPTSEHF